MVEGILDKDKGSFGGDGKHYYIIVEDEASASLISVDRLAQLGLAQVYTTGVVWEVIEDAVGFTVRI